ncbi:bifunctional nuclease family protein [Cyclobacteriaceae bacterium]|jgi:bifunctional DNase/RNase|nr:bifunctional nuclease family protein [bacterium]MDC1517444.1 bifunctional nuclease family protein [Cyclobacteriaceae bacterium]|tara:strand:+ start:1742 stop:2347 length:606 start_codon:yes stop_codon:yes gene_type:complete
MSDKVKMEILGLSTGQAQSGSFALVLGEFEGRRRLPIIIGMFEAQAIAIEIESITPNRPMTHDLFKSFAYHFDFQVKEILISDLKEGVFFAKLICEKEGKLVEIDSRPSDAIAIGLRFGVDIFTTDQILNEAAVVISEEGEEEDMDLLKKTKNTTEEVKNKPSSKLGDFSSEKLNDLLNKALEDEDYERAASLRDELNRRN